MVKGQRGFTLIELLVCVAIIGIIAAIVLPASMQFIYNARVSRAVAELASIERDILAYGSSAEGGFPATLADLDSGVTQDPWGNAYVYVLNPAVGVARTNLATPVNSDFDLYSIGQDGLTAVSCNDDESLDDIVRVNDGAWRGLAGSL